MLPQENFDLDPLRLLLMQSETRLLFNTCDKTIITILNFKISGGGGGGGVGGIPGPPLLCMRPWPASNYNQADA